MQTRLEAFADLAGLDDTGLVRRAFAGEPQAFRAIMQRYNRRLYRVARGIVGNDAERPRTLFRRRI